MKGISVAPRKPTFSEEIRASDGHVRLRHVFVYSCLDVGGVETLIVRLSNWLVANGHDVLLVLIKPGKLDHLLHPAIETIFLGGNVRAFLPWLIATKIGREKLTDVDVLCAFDPQSLWMAMLCVPLVNEKARLFVGVYHPRIYFFSRQADLRAALHLKLLRGGVMPESIAFMNEACRASHESSLGMDFSRSRIFPLPIADSGVRSCAPLRFKVVSVGRLTAFKTYNIYMIDVVHALVTSGMTDVSWHVYGDGPLLAEMLSRIEDRGLQDHIILHGVVPYEELFTAIADAYAFVGMGTALIEAGSYGVPSIPAIESEGAVACGYIYELDGFNVGEMDSRQSRVEVQVLLERLFAMSETEYKAESDKTRNHCVRFLIESVGNEFVSQSAGLGRVQSLKSVAMPDILAYALVAMSDALISFFSAVFIRVGRMCFPPGAVARLRAWNRRRLARKNAQEMAPGAPGDAGKRIGD